MSEETMTFDLANEEGDVWMKRYYFDMFLKAYLANRRVRDLHKPWRNTCGDCDQSYPCDTVRILDGERV